jgi:hypothetical protein
MTRGPVMVDLSYAKPQERILMDETQAGRVAGTGRRADGARALVMTGGFRAWR